MEPDKRPEGLGFRVCILLVIQKRLTWDSMLVWARMPEFVLRFVYMSFARLLVRFRFAG